MTSHPPEGRLWTPMFVGVMLINGLVTLNFLLLMSYMTSYAVLEFGVGRGAAGLAAGTFVLGALIARIFVGKFTDVVGRRRMLLVASLVLVAGAGAYFFAVEFWLLIVARTVQGIAFGSISNVITTIAMSHIPQRRRGEGTGWFTLSATLGQALGPALGVWLASFGDPRVVFALGLALCVLAGVLGVIIPIKENAITASDRREIMSWRFGRIFEVNALPMGTIAFMLSLPYAAILTMMTGYAAEVGLLEYASAYFVVYALSLAVSRPLAGSLLDRFSDNAVVLPAFVPYLAALSLLALDFGVVGYFAAAVLVALGYGTLISLLQAIAVRETPAPRTSLAVSTFYIGLDSGLGVGPALLGVIIGTGLLFQELYGILVAWVALVAVVYLVIHGRKPSARAPRQQ